MEASASLNLGWAAMQINHFDEAVDWSRTAYRSAVDLGAEDKVQIASGNLGWAYFQLGDDEKRARVMFLPKRKRAPQGWGICAMNSNGSIMLASSITIPATQPMPHQVLSPGARSGKADRQQGRHRVRAGRFGAGLDGDRKAGRSKRLSRSGHSLWRARVVIGWAANVMLTRGMLAAARHQDQQAGDALSR